MFAVVVVVLVVLCLFKTHTLNGFVPIKWKKEEWSQNELTTTQANTYGSYDIANKLGTMEFKLKQMWNEQSTYRDRDGEQTAKKQKNRLHFKLILSERIQTKLTIGNFVWRQLNVWNSRFEKEAPILRGTQKRWEAREREGPA